MIMTTLQLKSFLSGLVQEIVEVNNKSAEKCALPLLEDLVDDMSNALLNLTTILNKRSEEEEKE